VRDFIGMTDDFSVWDESLPCLIIREPGFKIPKKVTVGTYDDSQMTLCGIDMKILALSGSDRWFSYDMFPYTC